MQDKGGDETELGCWLKELRPLFWQRAFEDVCIGKDIGNKCLRKPSLVERWKTAAKEAMGRVPMGDYGTKNQDRGSTKGGVAVRVR